MKRFFCLLFVLVFLPLVSLADLPDISGLSFDELVLLRDQLNLAIWNSKEWQEVKVPIGVWKIGDDIPVGKWTISAASDDPDDEPYVIYCNLLTAGGTKASSDSTVFFGVVLAGKDSDDESRPASVDIECKEGMFIVIQYAPALFTPYAGKPDLGFH